MAFFCKKFQHHYFNPTVVGSIAVGVIVPLVLVIAVTVTVVVSIVVCQTKRAKKITATPNSIYADPTHSLEVNEGYEIHFVTRGNVAYATNMDLKQNQAYTSVDVVDLGKKDNVQSEEAYATVSELQPYATVTTVTKGSGAAYEEGIVRGEECGGNKSNGSAIVTKKNEASKPESSSGAVDEYTMYTDLHAYDSI